MGVFHWGPLVSNYEFLEGQAQCLKSRLVLVVVSWLVIVDLQNIKYV